MKSLLMVLVMLLLGQAGGAWARCAAGSVSADFGAQSVDAMAPVGTEFASTVVTVNYYCDSPVMSTPDGSRSNDVVFQLKPTGAETERDFVYATGVEGVGVRVRELSTRFLLVKPSEVRYTNAANSFCWRPMTTGYDDERCAKLPVGKCPLGRDGGQCTLSFRASLIKLGAVKGGNLNSDYGNILVYAPGTAVSTPLGKMRIGGTVASRTSCTIRDMKVDLGRVSINTLASDGQSAPTRFDVSLSGCDPNQQVALVFTTFAQVGESCDGLTANSLIGTATGVAVKVWQDGGAAMCWRRRILYTVRPDGSVSVPMQAVVKRLGASAGAGTVVGSMVVQATYR